MDNTAYKMSVLGCIMTIVAVINNSKAEAVECSTSSLCICSTSKDGIFADCSNQNLTAVPRFADDVTSIDLSFNLLEHLPTNDDIPYGLKHLNISINNIQTLSIDGGKLPFWQITTIQSLNLSSNNFSVDNETFPLELFQNFTSLEILDITNNKGPREQFTDFDKVMANIRSLTYLAIDVYKHIVFGPSFRTMNLTTLKLHGTCNSHRRTIIDENFFVNLPNLINLDLSAEYIWTLKYFIKCSLTNIFRGALRPLTRLQYLDISNNRLLGMCGFKNVTYDLNFTNIRVLKANNLHCEDGISITLFCNDVKALNETSLEELHIEGNNIANGQYGLGFYLPASLQVLKIGNNRWVAAAYAYASSPFGLRLFTHLKNLHYVDMSNTNSLQFSQDEFATYAHCISFSPDVTCEKSRGISVWSDTTITNDGWCLPSRDHYFLSATQIKQYDTQLKESSISRTSKKILDASIKSRSTWKCIYPVTDCFDCVYTMIPPNLKVAVLKNSRLGNSIPWVIFSSDTLEKLDLSNNHFQSFKGPICNATKLRFLDLSGNMCYEVAQMMFDTFPALEHLFLNDNLIGLNNTLGSENASYIFNSLQNLETLNLSSNRISQLHNDVFRNLRNLKKLDIKFNLLTDWSPHLEGNKNLQKLDLSNNQINYLSRNAMKKLDTTPTNFTVDLSNNPLKCTCSSDSIQFIKWISKEKRKFIGFDNYICTDGDKIILLKNALKQKEVDCRSNTALIVSITVVTTCIIIIIIIIIIRKHKWKLTYMYYLAKRRYLEGYQELRDRQEFKFDAFVSYSDEDRHFVLHDIIRELEVDGGYKLCIHHRDFIPGCDIAENIISAIHHSRKHIFVLTTSFFESSWCMYEFNIAQTECLMSRQGENLMLLIFKEDIPPDKIPRKIRQIIEEKSYVQFPVEREDVDNFWRVVKIALSE